MSLPEFFPGGYQHIQLEKDDIICQQYEEVQDFYILVKGTISIRISLEQPQKEVIVGKTHSRFTPIGWSGFNSPGRYSSTIICQSREVELIRWIFDDFKKACAADPFLFDFVIRRAFRLIEESLVRHKKYAFGIPHEQDHPKSHHIHPEGTCQEALGLIRKSPFFGNVGSGYLKRLSELVEKRKYGAGETIYSQGTSSEGIFLLVQGRVILNHVESNRDYYPFRSISTPGFLVGWTSILHTNHIVEAVAQRETTLYFIPQHDLDNMMQKDPVFSRNIKKSILWLFGNLLQIIRGRLLQQRTDKDNVAIRHLIEHNKVKFKLSSRIHTVPHLLMHRDTIGMGLSILREMNDRGDRHEKLISSVCLDLLNETQREHNFYQGLQDVYNVVTSTSADADTGEVRLSCAKTFAEAFKWVHYQLEGREHLPQKGGNIFIYNHLLNHPHYTLPNNFQITIDAHFISSMILFQKYGDPGFRIVRIGKGVEYAHQEYYRRLGYINVYTQDSNGKKIPDPREKQRTRKTFMSQAQNLLKAGNNLVISPEGISNATENSPGPFKIGAFKLALSVPGACIIPITLAYFDRRITDCHYACTIHPPLHPEDHLQNPEDPDQLWDFVGNIRNDIAKKVKNTRGMVTESQPI